MTQSKADKQEQVQATAYKDTVADATQQMTAALRGEISRHQQAINQENMDNRRNIYAIVSRFKAHTGQM